LGPAQCYSTDRVGFRPHAIGFRLPLVTVSPCMRRTAHVRCVVGLIPSWHGFIEAKDPLFFLFARLCSLLRACYACHRALCCRRVHHRSSALRDAAPQASHRVARRPVNRHHRPLLRPVTDGSPPPELPRAPPHAPLPLVFFQPNHHPMRSPPTHRPSTAHQQLPSTCGPRCRRRACPPDRRRREQPDSDEDSHF
jgi:hypothetical protein